MTMNDDDFPALYNSADSASLDAQRKYFCALRTYLILLMFAAFVSFQWNQNLFGAIASAILFLITLLIIIWLKVKKPEDVWYNGRAVAESVKTITWRWIMNAEPYDKAISDEKAQRKFLWDLKDILDQNRSLSEHLEWSPRLGEAISDTMIKIRNLSWEDRLIIYKRDRIDNQSIWYSEKAQVNKHKGKQWFKLSILLHSFAIIMLLYRIKEPLTSLPVEVIATGASCVLTWVQAKKHNELSASYALAAHEIVLIKGESVLVKNEVNLSEFVVNSESAFSREHTQWVARKSF